MDCLAGTSFFLKWWSNGTPVVPRGSPLLWQYLFWFSGIQFTRSSSGMGIVASDANTRKLLWVASLVFAALVLGFPLSSRLGAPMWLTGMGSVVSAFSDDHDDHLDPSVIFSALLFLALGRFNRSMFRCLWTAFPAHVRIGGLTGILLAFNSADLYLHDTHYVIAFTTSLPGTIFACSLGFISTKGNWSKDERVLKGVHLAVVDHEYHFPADARECSVCTAVGHDWSGLEIKPAKSLGPHWVLEYADLDRGLVMGLAQIFHHNFFWSIKAARKFVNPWQATTLEWTALSPPHGNFRLHLTFTGSALYARRPRIRFTMQTELLTESDRKAYEAGIEVPRACTKRPWKFSTQLPRGRTRP